jgi:ATP adenylyltransferase
MDIIFAHGRMDYIKGRKPEGCVFCEQSIRDENLVLYENNYVFISLNKYPYNTGHLLIVPRRHIGEFSDLSTEERFGMFDALGISIEILKEYLKPEGFNTGMNIGKAGGAGIADHLHMHIVPRWSGDTNFMTCVAETRIAPEEISVTCQNLKKYFDKFKQG